MSKVDLNLSYNERVVEAAKEYIARKERKVHPDGNFDSGGRWYPTDSEECTCCEYIRNPSRSWPFSLMKHCRTLQHVANLFAVQKSDVNSYIRKQVLPEIEEGYYYKEVAVREARFFSVFDGTTEYVFEKTLKGEAKPFFKGGFYVYRTVKEAENAVYPKNSKFIKEPRAILKLNCRGNYEKYDNGKIAFSEVTPVELVENAS